MEIELTRVKATSDRLSDVLGNNYDAEEDIQELNRGLEDVKAKWTLAIVNACPNWNM